jgi:hypothetical protein
MTFFQDFFFEKTKGGGYCIFLISEGGGVAMVSYCKLTWFPLSKFCCSKKFVLFWPCSWLCGSSKSSCTP